MTAAPGTGMGWYVYGVVPESEAAAAVEDLPAVANADAQVTFVRHEGLAAVVSEVPTDRPLGTPDDLRAHTRVLDSFATASAPVLPFRFGTVLRDVQSVTDELLASGHDDFADALDRLKGCTQFTLKARYVEEAVLGEVLAERPEVRQLRDELKNLPEDAGYYQRVRLGELVSDAIAAKRDLDSREIDRSLARFAQAVTTSEPASGEGVVDASFLVANQQRRAFERAAEDLARRWHGRIRLRMLGPLAPYDFVADMFADAEEGR